MHKNCRTLTNSWILWDGASTICPISLTPKRNKRLKWECNLSLPVQHNNQEDTRNSFYKELQCSLLDDGAHKNKKSVSFHGTTKCRAHEEQVNLSRIHSLSNCHHDALIVVLPWIIPSFSMQYLKIDIHNNECEHKSCNSENMWAIICVDKFNIATPQAIKGC